MHISSMEYLREIILGAVEITFLLFCHHHDPTIEIITNVLLTKIIAQEKERQVPSNLLVSVATLEKIYRLYYYKLFKIFVN